MKHYFSEINIEFKNKRLIYFYHSLMFMAIAVGAYVRFKGNGKWPLAFDEYFMAKSIGNILENGVPRFECGGLYMRGIVYQDLAAPILLLGSNIESGLRSISTFFNLTFTNISNQ